jgi:hypothetical protein
MIKSLFSFVFITFFISAFAQVDLENWENLKKDPNLGTQMFFQYKLHIGNHAYTGRTFSEYLQSMTVGNELRLGWRTDGSEDWQKALNNPLFGVGVYGGNIGDPQFLGTPSGVYGFIHFPFLRSQRHHFNGEIAAGLTYDLVSYNAETNPDNDAIGSSVAVYFNAHIGGDIIISRSLDLTYGVDLTHFSNGRTFTPNYGINIFGFNLGIRKNFNPIKKGVQLIDPGYEPNVRPILDRSPMSPAPKSHDINFYASIGTVMYEIDGGRGPRYNTWTTYLEYARRYGHIGNVNVGLDFMYDGSIQEAVNRDSSNTTPWQSSQNYFGGVHVGHSLFIERFNIETQLGIYTFKEVHYKGDWYMRVSLKYRFKNDMFAQIGLKTLNGGAADWIEWGIGYKLFSSYRKKQKREQ